MANKSTKVHSVTFTKFVVTTVTSWQLSGKSVLGQQSCYHNLIVKLRGICDEITIRLC